MAVDEPAGRRPRPGCLGAAVWFVARAGRLNGVLVLPPEARVVGYFPVAFDALAAAFISCLWARTLTSDSGPVMSATERNESGSP